jgi:hypothetical protein
MFIGIPDPCTFIDITKGAFFNNEGAQVSRSRLHAHCTVAYALQCYQDAGFSTSVY